MIPVYIIYATYVKTAEANGHSPTVDEQTLVNMLMLRNYPNLSLVTDTIAGCNVLCVEGLDLPDTPEYRELWQEFLTELAKSEYDFSRPGVWTFPKKPLFDSIDIEALKNGN